MDVLIEALGNVNLFAKCKCYENTKTDCSFS